MTVLNATQRFSSRVDNYIRYRPGYPAEILALLKRECALKKESVIADIGSGTGLLSRMFLENGNVVYGVEPNSEMRKAGERLLASYSQFHSIAGTAESTTLPVRRVDFVTAAQAAHWFDRKKARAEFIRILKPGGWLVLVWNERCIDTPFLRDYEQLLLTYATSTRRQALTTFSRLRHSIRVPSKTASASIIRPFKAGSCPLRTRRRAAMRDTHRCSESSVLFSIATTKMAVCLLSTRRACTMAVSASGPLAEAPCPIHPAFT